MDHRLAFLGCNFRSVVQLQPGVLSAPIGNVAIAFANMVSDATPAHCPLALWDFFSLS